MTAPELPSEEAAVEAVATVYRAREEAARAWAAEHAAMPALFAAFGFTFDPQGWTWPQLQFNREWTVEGSELVLHPTGTRPRQSEGAVTARVERGPYVAIKVEPDPDDDGFSVLIVLRKDMER